MNLHLQDRVVFVTGGSSGIGRACALTFGQEGARVALSYRKNRDAAEATAAEISPSGERALIVRLDLGDTSTIETATQTILERWGNIDVLINNAMPYSEYGFGHSPPFENLPEEHWHRITRHALDGIFRTTQCVLPGMRSRGWGRIVLVSSEVAQVGLAGLAAYGTAKAALAGLCRSLAHELGPAGVLVNVVMPGLVTTEQIISETPGKILEHVSKRSISGRLSTPEDVAAAIVFLASGANGNVTGEILRVGGAGLY
jgi:NAD(P)-dependent dehydrogenase (short-subunit alcohol dehydrogenase family)